MSGRARSRLWTQRKHSPDCPTPVYHEGLVYLIKDAGVASCLRARTGEIVWVQRLFDRDCKASPVAGDGKIYFTSTSGESKVLEAGPEGKVLAENVLEGPMIATSAISDGKLYLRSKKRLFAVGAE